MQERILKYINQNQMIQKGDHIVVGVSGGADSVCLFHVLQQLQSNGVFTIAVAHINHGLRGDDAYADEEFTKLLCQQYDVPYKSISIDVKDEAAKRGMSIEEAGRLVRREIFEEFAKECGANKIALGHHLDDQAETVVFNLVRGSGLSGLCGIHPVNGKYIRPLLCVGKTQIEDYLRKNHLSWQIDETNMTKDYTRNKIRHSVIKELVDINPRAQEHIAVAAKSLQEVEAYLTWQMKVSYDHHTNPNGEGIFIDESVTAEDIVIQKRIMRECVRNVIGSLKDLSKEHIESMVSIFDKGVGKKIDIGKGFVIRRTYDGAIVEAQKQLRVSSREVDSQVEESTIAVPTSGEFQWKDDKFTCNIIKYNGEPITEKKYTKWLDYDKIKDDLVMRNRCHGDVIVTCASGGKKKLKDYFIDAKIPQQERNEMPLLVVSSEVLWIVGDRISEKYKVTSNTKQVLRICKEGEELT